MWQWGTVCPAVSPMLIPRATPWLCDKPSGLIVAFRCCLDCRQDCLPFAVRDEICFGREAPDTPFKPRRYDRNASPLRALPIET